MDYRLAGTDIRLTYLQDRRALARIDWTTVLDDLLDAGAPPNRLLWSDLDALTHVVLAVDRTNGRHTGVIGLAERTTSLESYLLVDAIMVRPSNAMTLPLAMLAHILARIVCLDGKPAALAARGGEPGTEPVLRALAASVMGAEPHPPMTSNVIGFHTACLARRTGAGLTVVDLRPVREAVLLRELRGLHRARPERIMVKVARTGGAMRRPRTTTHTDRSA